MGTYTKNLKLETPSYTDNADIPALTKKNNEIIDSEMIKRANGLDYNEQTGVLQLTGNNSKVGNPIQIKNNLPVTSMSSGTELKVNNYKQLIKFTKEGKTEQKSYIGKNLLNYIDNLQSISGLTNTINSDGSITTTGKPTANFTRIVKDYDITNFLEDGQKYTISQTDTSLKTMLQITAYKNDGTITYYSSRNGANVLTINKSIYTKFLACVQTTSMSLWGDESLTINNKYMLCKGTDTADTSFEPYCGGQASPNPDYPQEIKNVRGVENLLKLPDGTYESNGITTVIKDGVITLNGTATANSFINVPFNYNFIANKEYTLSAHNSQTVAGECYIRLQKNDTVYFPVRLNSVNSKYSINFSKNLTVETFNIRTEKGKTHNNFVIKPQLEEGPIAHNFVPNGSNYLQLKNTTDNESKIINIDLKGNNLCSNKDKSVKDELLVENGKAKIYKKIKEVVLNGTEGFAKTEEGFVLVTNDWGNKNKSATLSNYFTTYTNYSEFKEAKEGAGFLYENVNNFYIKIDGAITVNEFRAKLKSLYDSGNPVKVQYQLAEPKVIDLGEVDFDLIENSTLTCEEESDMQIDYLTISSNIFVQDSLDGSSSQKAPSVKAVNEAFDKISSYSSNEQLIGKWINGENLYRKVFEINMDSSSKEMTISTGISNMKQLTHAYGVGLYQNTIYIPLNFYNNLGWDSFHLTGKGASIILQRGDNFPITKVFITLEYTKNV